MSLQFDCDLLDCAGEPERSGDVGPGLDRRESNPRGRANRNSNDRLIHRPDGRPGRLRERRPLHPGSPFGQELLRLGVPAPPQRLHRPAEPQFVWRHPVLVASRQDSSRCRCSAGGEPARAARTAGSARRPRRTNSAAAVSRLRNDESSSSAMSRLIRSASEAGTLSPIFARRNRARPSDPARPH